MLRGLEAGSIGGGLTTTPLLLLLLLFEEEPPRAIDADALDFTAQDTIIERR